MRHPNPNLEYVGTAPRRHGEGLHSLHQRVDRSAPTSNAVSPQISDSFHGDSPYRRAFDSASSLTTFCDPVLVRDGNRYGVWL